MIGLVLRFIPAPKFGLERSSFGRVSFPVSRFVKHFFIMSETLSFGFMKFDDTYVIAFLRIEYVQFAKGHLFALKL